MGPAERQVRQASDEVGVIRGALRGPDAASLRLATAFHILFATMTQSPILTRYVAEPANTERPDLVASRRRRAAV